MKGLQNLPKARVLFGNTKVTISTDGERHLGAAIGSTAFRDQYVISKVEETPPSQSPWCLLKFTRGFILFSCMAGLAPDGFGVPMSRRMPSRDVVPTRRKVLRHSGMQWP